MSSKTKYKCDFCRSEIVVTNHISGMIGFCMDHSDTPSPTNKIQNHKGSTHICLECVTKLADYINKGEF